MDSAGQTSPHAPYPDKRHQGTWQCPVCDLLFAPSDPKDRRDHGQHHRAHIQSCQRHGPLPGYAERERMKRMGYDAVGDDEASVADLVFGGETLMRAWFARSAFTAGPEHATFEVYASAMLAADAAWWEQRYLGCSPNHEAALAELRRRYPPRARPELQPGSSIWDPGSVKNLGQAAAPPAPPWLIGLAGA